MASSFLIIVSKELLRLSAFASENTDVIRAVFCKVTDLSKLKAGTDKASGKEQRLTMTVPLAVHTRSRRQQPHFSGDYQGGPTEMRNHPVEVPLSPSSSSSSLSSLGRITPALR